MGVRRTVLDLHGLDQISQLGFELGDLLADEFDGPLAVGGNFAEEGEEALEGLDGAVEVVGGLVDEGVELFVGGLEVLGALLDELG